MMNIKEHKFYPSTKNYIKLLLSRTCILLLSIIFVGCSSTTLNNHETYDENIEESFTITEKKVYIGHADYPRFDSAEDLYNSADWIVQGKIIDQRVEVMSLRITDNSEEDDEVLNPGVDIEDEKDVVTIHTVEIETVYKGELQKRTIEVMQLGGETNDAIYRFEGAPEFQIDNSYLLFLSKSIIVENAAWLLNDLQATYEVHGDKIISSSIEGFSFTHEMLLNMTREDNLDK